MHTEQSRSLRSEGLMREQHVWPNHQILEGQQHLAGHHWPGCLRLWQPPSSTIKTITTSKTRLPPRTSITITTTTTQEREEAQTIIILITTENKAQSHSNKHTNKNNGISDFVTSSWRTSGTISAFPLVCLSGCRIPAAALSALNSTRDSV